MGTKAKSYIICADTYGKSCGPKVLYKLRDELASRGFKAYMFCYGKRNYNPDVFIDDITDEQRNNDIVVYPEVFEGNPLGFRNVVRYVLQDPEFWGMSREFDSSEKIFVFDVPCYPNAPYLRFDTIDRNLFFYDKNCPKDMNCYFVYKRGKFRDVPEIKDWCEITMKWPEKREDLAKLLQRTKNFYSFDDRSSILVEAQLCGAQVKIITKDGIEDFTKGDEFDQSLFEKQMQFFIDETQRMDYTGEINTQGIHSYFDFILNKLHRFGIRCLYLLSKSQKLKKLLKCGECYRWCNGYIFQIKRKIYDVQ